MGSWAGVPHTGMLRGVCHACGVVVISGKTIVIRATRRENVATRALRTCTVGVSVSVALFKHLLPIQLAAGVGSSLRCEEVVTLQECVGAHWS